jgi:hypothetical protein
MAAGIAIGGCMVAALLGILIFILLRRRRRSEEKKTIEYSGTTPLMQPYNQSLVQMSNSRPLTRSNFGSLVSHGSQVFNTTGGSTPDTSGHHPLPSPGMPRDLGYYDQRQPHAQVTETRLEWRPSTAEDRGGQMVGNSSPQNVSDCLIMYKDFKRGG